jgi:hypothetical protein
MDIEHIKNINLNFILATARTGSTLLSAMLNMHSNVISTIEEPFAYSIYPKYKNVTNWTSKTIQEFCDDFYLFSEGRLEIQFGTRKDLETLLEIHKENLTYEIAIKITYLCFFPNKNKNKITTIVDKQLKFHFYLEKVANIYPTSKFIILYRDPRDTVILKQRILKIQNNKQQGFYKISNNWKSVYGKLLHLKNKIGSYRFLEIKYEDLVSNPEIELKKICSFLNIPFQLAMLEYDEQVKNDLKRKKEQLSNNTQDLISVLHDGISQKVHTNKIGIWKKELTQQDVNLIWTVCGYLASKIGYEKPENFVSQKIKASDYLTLFSMYINRKIIILYFSLPFNIRYLIKKTRYTNRYKSDGYTSESFYKNNL